MTDLSNVYFIILGGLLNTHRSQLGVSRPEVERQCGFSESTLGIIERGKKTGVYSLIRLCEALNNTTESRIEKRCIQIRAWEVIEAADYYTRRIVDLVRSDSRLNLKDLPAKTKAFMSIYNENASIEEFLNNIRGPVSCGADGETTYSEEMIKSRMQPLTASNRQWLLHS